MCNVLRKQLINGSNSENSSEQSQRGFPNSGVLNEGTAIVLHMTMCMSAVILITTALSLVKSLYIVMYLFCRI